jgi:hypothetical protein
MKKLLATSLMIATIFAGTLGNSGLTATANAATVSCAAPCITSACQNGNNVNLCFNKVAGATQYKVYCSNSKNGTYKCVGTTNCGTFQCPTTGSKPCYYKVVACNGAANANSQSACSKVISTCPTR